MGTAKLREITFEERATIERLVNSPSSSDRLKTRACIILYSSQGERSGDIAKRLNISPKTVRHWVKQFNERGLDALGSEIITCPNCTTIMPSDTHFCRQCGQALKMGVVAVADSQSEQTAPPGAPLSPPPAYNPLPTSYTPPQPAHTYGAGYGTSYFDQLEPSPTRSRFRWILISLLIVGLIIGVGIPLLMWNRSAAVETSASDSDAVPVSRSYFGVIHFRDAEGGGAYLEGVYPPGSPADRAGLLGGDIITSYDAKTVRNASELSKMVAETPIGSTVQIVYIRDGETRTTKLTTASMNEIIRLDKMFDERPEGKGFMGEGNNLERVYVPSMKIYGVQLKGIRPNLPADRAGLLNGDIVIEFDGYPIRTHKDLELRVERTMPNVPVKVVVVRNEKRLEIPITLMQNY